MPNTRDDSDDEAADTEDALAVLLAEPVRCAASMFDLGSPEIVFTKRSKTIAYHARRGVIAVNPVWLTKNVEALGFMSDAQAAVLLSLVLKVFVERESKVHKGREREIHVYARVGQILGDMGCPPRVVKRATPVFVGAHQSHVLSESERASCVEHGFEIAKEDKRKPGKRRRTQ